MATDERAVDMELVASHHIQSVSYYMLTAHTIKKRVGVGGHSSISGERKFPLSGGAKS